MMKTTEFRWDLLERIKRNSEDWDLDEGKELCRGFVMADVLENGLSRGAIATG